MRRLNRRTQILRRRRADVGQVQRESATRAPDLELSEMVAVLGRRSERLSELWNRWGRVRPLLLEVQA